MENKGIQRPFYISLEDSIEALAEIGIEVTLKQMKRAVEPDANGKRKLPYFKDLIDGRLKINKHTLLKLYMQCEIEAERNIRAPQP